MVVSARQSMRTKMLMYFPPFRMMAWLMGGVKDIIVNAMTRSTMRGATGEESLNAASTVCSPQSTAHSPQS